MKAKKAQSLESAVTTTDTAWRVSIADLDAKTQAAKTASAQYEHDRQSAPKELRYVIAERERLEAVADELVARATASLALDNLEASQGDADVTRIASSAQHEQLLGLREEYQRAQAVLAAMPARYETFYRETTEAEARVASRRAAAGLPPPTRSPCSVGRMDPQKELDELASRAAGNPPKTSRNDTLITRLTAKERELRIAIETAHRKAEEAARRREENEREHARRTAEDNERTRRQTAEWREKQNAKLAENEALIAAQKAREEDAPVSGGMPIPNVEAPKPFAWKTL